MLPRLLPDGVALSAVEAAVLVAAPFLHEAAWANRLSAAKEIRPLEVSVERNGDARRRHYEQVAENHRHITRKAADSLLRGSVDDVQNVALWLVHRWITEQFETDEHAIGPAYVEPFAAALLGEPGPGSARVGEFADAVQEIASAVSLGAPLEDAPPREVRVRLGWGSPQLVRVRPLAVLVHLAAVLALDIRALPDVVAEHLAVPDGVLPQDVVAALHDADWYREDEALHLDAVCPHPAIHAALAGAVERADELACAVAEAAQRLPAGDAGLLAGVPARVTDRRLRPLESRGRRAYDVPLLRFQLDQTEVRELLMGERLYEGRPELALRELYQNAMDACRYRSMRWRYLKGQGREPRDWEGQISFFQGEDGRGRYVECRDTGVGMGVEQLKSTFTKAGRRFEQSRSFRREQESWLRHDRTLRLHPNSRFGIGVFSYFMLADEMTIVTRPVDPDGVVAAKALLVHISSSGSLFRIREYDEPGGDAMPEGGTRVRLHLREGGAAADLSCVDVLRSLVLVSEFALQARDGAGARYVWQPGVLQPMGGSTPPVEAVPRALWWVAGDGAVVCDGIRTDHEPFGYVLNLTGAHAGELSVSRTKLQNYDRAWETELWRQGAAALASWPGLTMSWLWEMESDGLRCARVLWEFLQDQQLSLPIGGDSAAHEHIVPLKRVGCFGADSSIDRPQPRMGRATRAWRIAALGHKTAASGQYAPPASLAGYPVPSPGWSGMAEEDFADWRRLITEAHTQRRTVSEALRILRALRITSPFITAPPNLPGSDLDWVPAEADLVITQGLMGSRTWDRRASNDLYSFEHAPHDLRGLVRASARARIPLGELVERCRRYVGLMPGTAPQVPEHHRNHVCDSADMAVLYFKGPEGLWAPTARPWDLVSLARITERTPQELAEHVGRFAWLGWPSYSGETVDRWFSIPESGRSYLIHFIRPDAEGNPALPWAATLAYAGQQNLPLSAAEEELGAWATLLGLSFQRRYFPGAPARDLIPTELTGDFSKRARAQGISFEHGVSLRDFAYARPRKIRFGELTAVVDDLRHAGVEVSEGDQLLKAWDGMRHFDKQPFTGRDLRWEGANYPVLPTPAVLVSAACQLEEPLGTTWETAQSLSTSMDLRIPQLPEQLSAVAPGRAECAALIDDGSDFDFDGEWQEPPRWAPLTPSVLIDYARRRGHGPAEAYRQLSPFQALGALVPLLSETVLAALPCHIPTAHDVIALDEEQRVSELDGPRVPLDIVSAAARLGEPVSTTWDRIVPYLPLDPAPAEISSAPDVLPLWQDLIVLSVHCDGLLPALHGPVAPGHISLAAWAVGEDEAWVCGRLAHYAQMFSLELPDMHEAELDD